MSIQQTKKQSDLEKRLRLLRQQVYGKSSKQLGTTQIKPVNRKNSEPEKQNSDILIYRSTETPSHSDSIQTDITYLNQDLLKILLFSSVAIGVQIILFVLTKNHILNLNFF